RVAAAGAFRVISVDRAAGNRRNGGFEESGFVDGIGVNGNLDVVFIDGAQAGVNRRGGRAPVFVELQAAGAGFDLFSKRLARRRISLPQEAEIHRPCFGGLQHAREVPGTGGAGGGGRAGGGASAAADHGGNAARNRLIDLLRGNEVDVAIHPASGDDQVFARDNFRARADNEVRVHSIHRVWIPGLANLHDAAVPNSDIAFDDAPMVEDDCVGDDQIEGAALPFGGCVRRGAALAHAVANHFAAAKGDFVAVVG